MRVRIAGGVVSSSAWRAVLPNRAAMSRLLPRCLVGSWLMGNATGRYPMAGTIRANCYR